MNEFRQDIVSGEWVLFAPDRAKRGIRVLQCEELNRDKEKCPFEDLEGNGNTVLKTYDWDGWDGWFAKVINNKYPAVARNCIDEEAEIKKIGPFRSTEARGAHEVIVYGNHDKLMMEFDEKEMAQVFRIYKDRYEVITKECASEFILIFNNHGSKAGGSLYHPHSQIISTPVMPPDVEASVKGSERYYMEYKEKVYDAMIRYEMQEGKRIIAENDDFVAFCPFASKTPYEMRVFPKEDGAHFNDISENNIINLGDIVSKILKKMDKVLKRPDYNFFIHTSPLHRRWEKPEYFYTWHIEILPKISLVGGFEIGSGIYVNVIDPDDAARQMRDAEI
ncbi:MAG: DUF4921 family protein [bacterium]|nr:DUF4921 family protein [bacterium]